MEPHREEIPQQPIPAPDVGQSQPYVMVHPHSYVQPPAMQTPMALYPPPQPVYTNPRPHMMPQVTHPSSMTQPAQPIVNSLSARDLEQYGQTILDILKQRGCNVNEILQSQAGQAYGVLSARNTMPPLSQPPTPGAFGVLNNPVPDAVDHLSAAINSPSPEPIPKSRRKSSSSTPITQNSRSKGKSKKDDQPIPRPRRRSPSSSEPSWSPLPPPPSPSSEGHPPTPPAPRPTGSPRPPGMVFTSSSGAPLSFFVQIDLTHRLSLVNRIKVCLVPPDIFTSHRSVFDSISEKQGDDRQRQRDSRLRHS